LIKDNIKNLGGYLQRVPAYFFVKVMVWLIALSSNYKSLVDLFKGRGCGQSPQILSAYAI